MWSKKDILIIGAHFDDHILGCGGLMAKYKTRNMIMSDKFQFGAMNTYAMSELADYIEPMLAGVDIVFTHWPYDWNSDHKAVAEATLIACRRKPITLYFYEVLSSTEQALKAFKPNTYLPLTKDMVDNKIREFWEIKGSNEVRNDVNLLTQMKMRGIECLQKYAEAFILFRQVL